MLVILYEFVTLVGMSIFSLFQMKRGLTSIYYNKLFFLVLLLNWHMTCKTWMTWVVKLSVMVLDDCILIVTDHTLTGTDGSLAAFRGSCLIRTLDIGHWTLDTGHWTLDMDTGYWTLDIRHSTLDTGYWTLDIRHWT